MIFTMLHLKKINKEKHLQFLRYRGKHTEIGNLRSSFALLPPKTPKIKMLKMKKIAGNAIILYMCTKNSF